MKNFLILLAGVLCFQIGHSQTRMYINEDFDNQSISFNPTPTGSWTTNTTYYTSSPNSYHGIVPNNHGDSIILETPDYDFETEGYTNIIVRFRHICKVEPSDTVRVEYLAQRGTNTFWAAIPPDCYLGASNRYLVDTGFNAGSYSQWESGNMLINPSIGWWKEEVFDVTYLVSLSKTKFRFVIKRGPGVGTQRSYGWLIDDFEIIADKTPILLPTVEFTTSNISDTLHSSGPFEIRAKVKTNSSTPLKPLYLKYISTLNGVSTTDSSLLINVQGDSLWKATIPQSFLNTQIAYSIKAEDNLGNYSTAKSGYVIAKNRQENYGNNSVSLLSINSPTQDNITGGTNTPIRITLQNKGDLNLSSVTVNWKINNDLKTPFTWTGNLAWDYKAQNINIGSFSSSINAYDTITIWLTNPNGSPDIATHDDTISIILFSCAAGGFAGDYIVGKPGAFPSIKEAINALTYCGIANNVVFKLQKGIYKESVDLTDLASFLGNYTCKITSLDGNRDSVIIQPPSGDGLTLGNINNFIIEAITIDAVKAVYPIRFTNACTNIVINNCKLLANPSTTTSTHSVIYKPGTTGILQNIRITNNTMDGSYQAIQLYGGDDGREYGRNIIIDSNIITNQYYYGLNILYCDSLSVSYNKVYSRNVNFGAYWTGIRLLGCNGKIIGNNVKQVNKAITTPTGISAGNINNSFTTEQGIIANNEIILYPGVENKEGLSITGSKVLVLHNSIYMEDAAFSSRALSITSGASNSILVKNNNLIVSSMNAYPIYISTLDYLEGLTIDYNNYYAPQYIGYIGSPKSNLPAWKLAIATDQHSVSIQPAFINNSVSLELSNGMGLNCPLFYKVNTDIIGQSRTGLTTMGCYSMPLLANNATLTEISVNNEYPVSGMIDSIKVIVTNSGTNNLYNVNIGWKYNNTNRPTITWTGTLNMGQSVAVFLDTISYKSGLNSITAWINNIGGPTDGYAKDDTLSVEYMICDSMLNGGYTIGTNGADFTTITNAVEKLYSCGINGAVRLELQDEIFRENIVFSGDIYGTSSTNTITITSASGNRDMAVIRPSGDVGITLGFVNHLIFDGITVDAATSGTHGFEFIAPCTNIIITNSTLLTNPTLKVQAENVVIYKKDNTGILNNIQITNNIINGGGSGIYLYGGSPSTKGSVTIDNNIIQNQYFNAIYLHYVNAVSLSHNTMLSRTEETGGNWYGMNLNISYGKINANKIRQRSSAIVASVGIYLSNLSDITKTTLITNNEIMIIGNSSISYGIRFNGIVHSSILHNSIYVDGTFANRGINITNNDHKLAVKNNIIITKGTASYPIYIATTSYLNNWDINYNNYHAPTNIGYVGGAARTSLPTWKSAVIKDSNSVSLQPGFINTDIDLNINSSRDLKCPLLTDANMDIHDIARTSITTMGAYHFEQVSTDITPNSYISLPRSSPLGNSVPVTITLYNMGFETIDSAIIHWSINGNTQPPYYWYGSLAPNLLTSSIPLGSFATVTGENKIKVWTSMPNGKTDENVSNDTLRGYVMVHNKALRGTYTVQLDDGDFSTMENVALALDSCGVGGHVIFSIFPGTYTGITLKNIRGARDTSTITFTSSTGIENDVTIGSVILDLAHYISLQNITIQASDIAAVQFKSLATNINIRNCSISADSATFSSSAKGAYGIYKPTTTGTVKNINIVGNTINGGIEGIHFYGGTNASYGTKVFLDNNIIRNQDKIGINVFFIDTLTITKNTLLSRKNTQRTWGGINGKSINGTINGNKIRQRTSVVASPYGITLSKFNTSTAKIKGLITNNEIDISSINSSCYGINIVDTCNAVIAHNSIYTKGDNGASVYIGNNGMINIAVLNNNLMAEDFCYPVLLAGTEFLRTLNLSNNNYYSPYYVGMIGNNVINTINDWKAIFINDHSVQVTPAFVDNTVSLELSGYQGLETQAMNEVPIDIKDNIRAGITAMGCYTTTPLTVEALLTEVLNWDETPSPGQKDIVKVVLRNGGSTPITSAVIDWNFNNVNRTPKTWTGSLAAGESDIITLDEISYISGKNQLTAWIRNLGGLNDGYPSDDTISVSGYLCDTLLNGSYTVGKTGVFSTIKESVKLLYTCGINGPVNIILLDSVFVETVELQGAIPGSSNINTVTFTSVSGNADKFRIQREGTYFMDEAPFILNSVSNIKISDLTLDGRSTFPGDYLYAKAVILKNKCDNIEINNCKLIVPNNPDITASVNHSAIYHTTNNGIVSNVRMLNNRIEGGNTGIYLHGLSATNRNNKIQIRNNVIYSVDEKGILLYNTDSVNITGNSIEQRNIPSQTTEFDGIYLFDVSGNILKNKIKAQTINNGIYTTNLNKLNQKALIANNEIIGNSNSVSAKNGIYIDENTHANIYHNSVLINGTGTSNALFVNSSDANTTLNIQNNNFVTASLGMNFPIYLNSNNNLTKYAINYNNYYSQTGVYVGYVGDPKTTLAGWQLTVTSDLNSMVTSPMFKQADIDLRLLNNENLLCPVLPDVADDINNSSRIIPNCVGAYYFIPLSYDIYPFEVVSPAATSTPNISTPVTIKIRCLGTDTVRSLTINWSLNGVTQTPFASWTGTLGRGNISSPITIGNFSPSPGENKIILWTSMPNNMPDENQQNDTIQMITHGCDTAMNGNYIVGLQPGAHYLTIMDAVKELYACGVNGAVVIKLQNGTYNELVKLSGMIPGASEINTVTFTSINGDRETVEVRRKDDASQDLAPFMLDGVSHIKISRLHLNAIPVSSSSIYYAKAIILTGECNNIEINDCKLSLPSGSANAIITENQAGIYYKALYQKKITDIRIYNNLIEGGAFGIYLLGENNTNRNKNILIENNILQTLDKTGIYVDFCDSASAISNKITQRLINNPSDFCGIHYDNITDGLLWGNSIKIESLGAGIYLHNVNNELVRTVLVANNEIIAKKGSDSSSGICVDSANTEFIHNSVLVLDGNVKGIEFRVTEELPCNARNNIFTTLGAESYPIYMSGTSGRETWNINFNNYYSPKYIGYINTGRTTMGGWIPSVTCDLNSQAIEPSYIDYTNSLELVNMNDFVCSVIPAINRDIKGLLRNNITVKGAYGISSLTQDITLREIANIPVDIIKNEAITPQIVFENVGLTTLTNLTIQWSFNGSAPTSISWTGSISTSGANMITLPTLSAIAGANKLTAWITSVNNNGLDMNQENDTIILNFYACDSLLRGDYIIGQIGDFYTLEDAFTRMNACGVGGNISLKLTNGDHQGSFDLTNLTDMMNHYQLTITSLSKEKDSVVIYSTSAAYGILLGKTNNLILKDITLDGSLSLYTIKFIEACTNIVIQNCNILGSPTATTDRYAAIYKGEGSGILNNIRIFSNVISGGYYGIYLDAGIKNFIYGKNVVIDSNIVSSQHYYGMYLLHTDITSLTANTVISKSSSEMSTTWFAIRIDRCNGYIVGNKIRQNNTAITYPYGIYSVEQNTHLTSKHGLIANNEIICVSPIYRGIYVAGTSVADIVNNSIYSYGNGAGQGIATASTQRSYQIRNNNIVMLSTTAYPIYLASGFLGLDIAYNNYYSLNNIGYATAARTSLATWVAIVPQDSTSKNMNPSFTDLSEGLQLINYKDMYCPRVDNVGEDIRGKTRTALTTMGAYGAILSDGYNLELIAIIEPKSVASSCAQEYVPVKYALFNGGTLDYDFSNDSIILGINIINNMGILPFDTVITINTGILEALKTDTFELQILPRVAYAGDYHITAWLSSPVDTIYSNDTLRSVYRTNKIALPYDERFNATELQNLTIENLLGGDTNVWKVVSSGYDAIINPAFGNKKLIFAGADGSATRLITGQVELNRTSQPKLEFWYAHDNSNEPMRDHLIVKAIFNGDVNNAIPLKTVYRHDTNYKTPAWVNYSVDLSPYVDSSCVIILFEAYSYGGVQHIDRITITSNQNLALDTILIPELSVCRLKNNDLKVVLSNTINQDVDFDNNPINILVRIRGSMTWDTIIPLEGSLEALLSDTITIYSGFDFNAGSYQIKAYLDAAVFDFNRKDDTTTNSITINPKLDMRIIPISNGFTNCAIAETDIYQELVIKNNGNMDVYNIGLILLIEAPEADPPYSRILMDTITTTIAPGDSIRHPFADFYSIPWSPTFQVQAYAYLVCDSAVANANTSASECVETDNLALTSIDKPSSGQIDTVGGNINIGVTLENRSDATPFPSVKIHARIEDSRGNIVANIPEIISKTIDPLQPESYTFVTPYTVPADSVYYITVFIEKQDSYQQDDTIWMKRITDYKVGIETIEPSKISMNQNIPNPAGSITFITYSIPANGDVVFTISSINGQVLYNKSIKSELGMQTIDINVSHLAAGIYFYSMEFNGQKITKRMSIKR